MNAFLPSRFNRANRSSMRFMWREFPASRFKLQARIGPRSTIQTQQRKVQRVNGSRYQIEYGPSALDDLDALPARERAQVLRKIERLANGLHGNIKRLHKAEVMFRLRMGDFRILFDLEKDVIVIRRIGNRKDVYD